MSNANGTNANAVELKTPNKVDQLHTEWVKAGAKEPSSTLNKKLVADYNAAKKVKDAAKAALEEAQAEESKAVEAIIRANGKGRLSINGENVIPMARGATVFFRGESTKEVKVIG